MAPAFSKLVPNIGPPGTHKWTISTTLSSGDNVDATTVKKRKLAAAAKEAEQLAALHRDRQPSVEVEDNPQDAISHVSHHASAEFLLKEDNYVTDLTGD